MSRYAGRNGVIYLAITGSGTPAAILGGVSWSLDMSTDKLEVTAFGDANKVYVQGLRDLQLQFEARYDDSETKIFAAAQSSTGAAMYLYVASTAPSKYAYGVAWLDASISVDVNGVATISGKGAAAGSWGINF